MKLTSLALLASLSFLSMTAAYAAQSPSHVFQQTEQMILEINHLRNRLNINSKARTPHIQNHKLPIHAYAKSIEVIEKIARIEKKYGMRVVKVEGMPLKKVTPDEVYRQTEIILEELANIQSAKNTGSSEQIAEYKDSKTPSDVYENLWKVSFLLDGLSDKIKPNDVYLNLSKVVSDIGIVAKNQRVELKTKLPTTDPKTKPTQVNLEAYINLHKISLWQSRLNMVPFRVPGYPEGVISPSDVYDTTSMMLAEMARIKVHLGITQPTPIVDDVSGKSPKHVLSLLELTEKNIDLLTAAARH